jgi:hypothetical protein
MVTPGAVFPVFFVIWAALAVGSLIFFTSNKDVALKKRVFPRLVIGSCAVFGLVIFIMAPWPAALLFAPFLALIAWLNIRMTRFCDACGKMLINHQWWSTVKFCPFCGAKLPER